MNALNLRPAKPRCSSACTSRLTPQLTMLKHQISSAHVNCIAAPAAGFSATAQPRVRSSLLVVNAGKGFGVVKPSAKDLAKDKPCPCGSGNLYGACCSPFHAGDAFAGSPEELLRSRYAAYFAKNANYIADTTHPESQEYTGSRATYIGAVKATQKRMDLKGLEILKQEEGRAPEEKYITFKITFADRSKAAGEVIDRTEKSRFLKAGGKWYFLDSEFV